jgi:hypothetical protein
MVNAKCNTFRLVLYKVPFLSFTIYIVEARTHDTSKDARAETELLWTISRFAAALSEIVVSQCKMDNLDLFALKRS